MRAFFSSSPSLRGLIRGAYASRAGRVALVCAATVLLSAVLLAAFKGQDREEVGRVTQDVAPTAWSDLRQACIASVGADGFGYFALDGPLAVVGKTVDLPVSCVVDLNAGASVDITDSTVEAENLWIADREPNGPTSVSFVGSAVRGLSSQAGLWVDLSDPEDEIGLEGTTLDFGLSVWLTIYGHLDVDVSQDSLGGLRQLIIGSDGVESVEGGASAQASLGGGLVAVVDSQLVSTDPETEGIILASGERNGVTVVSGSEFQSDGGVLIFGGRCETDAVTGSTMVCGPFEPAD